MKARKTKTRAKTRTKPKDLATSRKVGTRVKGGVWDARTQQTRQTSLVQDL
jgi:hypothetical protein